MELTVKDVANLLTVTEKTIYRWLKNGSLPAYRVSNHYRFNRAELLEWATSRQINVSADLFREPNNAQVPLHGLWEALSLGGIHYRVEGHNKESALRSVVGLMRLSQDVDRDFLLQVLLAREALASTAIGDGIAIPHVRNPIGRSTWHFPVAPNDQAQAWKPTGPTRKATGLTRRNAA